MNFKAMSQIGLAAMFVAGALAATRTGPERLVKRATTQAFMRQKLAYSQGILEGLTLEKYDVVSKNAIRLRNLSLSNQWFTIKQPDYLMHTTNFQKSVDALYLAAVDKKLDEATEAYIHVARNCVECHRLVRLDQRRNAGQPTEPKLSPEPKPTIIP